jgi:probable rRNA maturation factor
MIEVEASNRSGQDVDEAAAIALARAVLEAEGVDEGELGIAFVGPDEMRALKRDHLGVDEPTNVLSFPLDGTEPLPEGEPRALGDVVLCPQMIGDDWRWPLVHGLLHLLGYDHGPAMEERERAHLS